MKIGWAMVGWVMVLAGYVVGASAAEPSAVLQQPKGRVFVGQATVMTPARHGMPLYAGNRVVVTAGGNATVVYGDGCSVELAENSLLGIGGPDQCNGGQAVVQATGEFQNTRIGQAGPVRTRSPVATIRQIKGTGLVNRSKAARGMSLFRNYKVTAGRNSQIVVRYANDCEVVVEAGKSLVIGQAPECQLGRMGEESMQAAGTAGTGSAAAAGAAGAAGAVGAAGAATGAAYLLVPGGIMAGIAGTIVLSNENDDRPASP